MRRRFITSFSLLVVALFTSAFPRIASAAADDVATYVTIPASNPFDVKFGPDGNLYVCGQQSASTGKVWKVGPGGAPVVEFASGIFEPKGMAFDAAGNLYVSDWLDRVQPARIWKITPGGTRTSFATVPGATYMVVNNAGDLLVGTWGQLKVVRVTPAGVVSDFATGVGAAGDEVSGLDYDPVLDELYFGTGPNIKKVSGGGGGLTTIAGGLVGIYGLARNSLGVLYAARYSHRDLYTVPFGGSAQLYAGVHLGSGCIDGPRIGTARFGLPAGLTVNGPSLFIADLDCSSVRVIPLPSGVTTERRTTWGRVKTLYR